MPNRFHVSARLGLVHAEHIATISIEKRRDPVVRDAMDVYGDVIQPLHEKALPDEAATVSRLGMTYIHIPVDFQNPTDQDFDQFCAVMEQLKDVPVHVHCIANYRVSAFFYRYRRDVLGMDEVRARADIEEVWHPEGVWATFVSR